MYVPDYESSPLVKEEVAIYEDLRSRVFGD